MLARCVALWESCWVYFKNLFVSSLCTSIAHCVSLFQALPAQPPGGLRDDYVNFQATSSMSPWASLVASDSNQ